MVRYQDTIRGVSMTEFEKTHKLKPRRTNLRPLWEQLRADVPLLTPGNGIVVPVPPETGQSADTFMNRVKTALSKTLTDYDIEELISFEVARDKMQPQKEVVVVHMIDSVLDSDTEDGESEGNAA